MTAHTFKGHALRRTLKTFAGELTLPLFEKGHLSMQHAEKREG